MAKQKTLSDKSNVSIDLKSALTQLCQFTVESWSVDFHENAQNSLGRNVAWHK